MMIKKRCLFITIAASLLAFGLPICAESETAIATSESAQLDIEIPPIDDSQTTNRIYHVKPQVNVTIDPDELGKVIADALAYTTPVEAEISDPDDDSPQEVVIVGQPDDPLGLALGVGGLAIGALGSLGAWVAIRQAGKHAESITSTIKEKDKPKRSTKRRLSQAFHRMSKPGESNSQRSEPETPKQATEIRANKGFRNRLPRLPNGLSRLRHPFKFPKKRSRG